MNNNQVEKIRENLSNLSRSINEHKSSLISPQIKNVNLQPSTNSPLRTLPKPKSNFDKERLNRILNRTFDNYKSKNGVYSKNRSEYKNAQEDDFKSDYYRVQDDGL